MRVLISFKWAIRTLFRNYRRSLLTSVIIIVGISSIVSFFALKEGVHNKMIGNTTSFFIGDMQINSYYLSNREEEGIKSPQAIKDKLEAEFKGMKCTYRKIEAALVELRKDVFPVNLIGVIPAGEKEVSKLADTITEMNFNFSKESDIAEVIIGKTLAEKSGLGLGKDISIVLNTGHRYNIVKARVIGIYEAAMNQFDKYNVIIDYSRLCEITGNENATDIAIRYKRPDYKKKTEEIRGIIGDKYPVTSWEDILPDVVKLISLNNAAMYIVACIIYVIVFFSIANTLIMSFYEKLKMFGIMLGVGVTPAKLSFLLILETLILGTFSLLAGTILSFALIAYFSANGLDLSQFLSSNPYFMFDMTIYPEVRISDVFFGYGGFILSFLLASLVPILKLFNTKPVVILREYA